LETSVNAILSRLGHWAALDFGSDWFEAGQALGERDTAAASKAFVWARFCYERYNMAWRSSAASRWDPDGQDDIDAVDAALAELNAGSAVSADLPAWAADLLQGTVPGPSDSAASEEETPSLLKLAEIAAKIRALA
jgi:hypothetical protein